VLTVKRSDMPKESWKEKAGRLRTDVYALSMAIRDPRVPWYAKALMAMTIGYAMSPIDLIPDFIPVIGQIDDLIIVPAGISLAIKMIPRNVIEEYRQKARAGPIKSRTKWIVVAIIVSIWVVAVYFVARFIWPMVRW
jgi:uncharacterized membrane protein YkvA (DUF1232 family)